MGSHFSSLSGGSAGGKKKRKKKKNNKKKYPPRRKSSSSSESSSGHHPVTRHKKLRHQSDTSSTSSPAKGIPTGNVKQKTANYEQIGQTSKSKSSDRTGFQYSVENKGNNKEERIVTVHLDIPTLSKVPDRPYVPRTNFTMSTTAFETDCIKAHNEYRRCHGAPPLSRDPKLTAMAQEWANKIAKRGKLEHSNAKGYGENVAFSSKPSPTGFQICKMWYDEIKDYNFGRPGFAGNTGHFTQVVWKGSTHVGIGVATGSKGTFAVANYNPAGNITNPGYFKENVGKQKNKPSVPDSPKDSSTRRRSPRRRRSSSSSSDEGKRRGGKSDNSSKKTSGSMPKPGKTVETKTEMYTENGVRKKKTIVTTKVVTVTSEGTKTATSTETKIETIPDDSVSDKLKKLKVGKNRSRSRSSSDSSSSSDEEDDALSESQKRKFRRECLDRHNELRRKHGAPKLRQSSTLQDAAQRHASRMLRRGKLSHTSKQKYGENVAMKMPMPTGAQACDMWYDEKKDYDFSKSVFSGNTGHFTQVVWEGSTEIGVGVASNEDGKTYVACFYSPPGNMRGEFAKNVKRDR